MMVAARLNERGLRAETLLQFKAQNVAVKSQRPFKVGDFLVDVADSDARINGRVAHGWLSASLRFIGLIQSSVTNFLASG